MHLTGFEKAIGMPEEDLRKHLQALCDRNIPMGRAGKMNALGGLVIFLASDASSFITGQVFIQDGE
jgi:NAD(P)-dependent dehydrogenase (short-subunit alcohol dehydrogenase family)